MNVREFVERWSQSTLREQQAAQSHFNELCQIVGHKTPTELDPKGEFFTFEENVEKSTGGAGALMSGTKAISPGSTKASSKTLTRPMLKFSPTGLISKTRRCWLYLTFWNIVSIPNGRTLTPSRSFFAMKI